MLSKKIIYSLPLTFLLPLTATADQIEQKVACASDSTVLLYGQNAICQIDDELDTDKFTFAANEGDLVYITLAKTGGGYRPLANIYSPSNVNIQAMKTSTSANAYEQTSFKAIESGTYSINITDTAAGYYRVQVDSTKSAMDDIYLNYGANFQNTIDYVNDRDYFAIDMAADTTVSVTLSKASALYRPWVRIFSPSNVEVKVGRTGTSATDLTKVELNVYQSGTYIVEISDTAEGIYEISTLCVAGACPDSNQPQQPSLDYLTALELCRSQPSECGITTKYEDGVKYCKSNPVECGVAMPVVNADLSISMPLAKYGTSPVEKLWAELRYTGDMKWELSNFDFIKN